ncbi:MAG TPA: hypothetical protein VIF63_07790 [Candidatus Limnocylindrales bacterium]
MRILAAILLIVVLALGGGLIANAAYQAGLSTAIATAGATGTTVTPVVVPPYAYGYGWHGFGGPGFGLFEFLAGLFFLFLIFGLIRAIVFGRGPGGRGGWDRGSWGPGGSGHSKWEGHARETFEDWHRRAHDPSDPGTAMPTASSPPTTPTPTGIA